MTQIKEAGAMLAQSKATIACWAMGLTQHRNGVGVIQELVNLLLLNGHVGRPGAGFCPVRGHSNVQGDRTVGIWEAPTEAFLNRMQKGLGFPMPSHHGYDVVHAIQAMLDGKVDVFFCMGGNFLSAAPTQTKPHKPPKRRLDRSSFYQIKPISPHYRKGCSHFAVSGPNRDR